MIRLTSVYWLLFVFLISFCAHSSEEFKRLFNAGKFMEALHYADKNIPYESRSAALWVKIAQANERLGMVEKALASYLISSRLHTNHYASLLGAARISNSIKQFDNALSFAKLALDIQFTKEASLQYAIACVALRKTKEAKKALEKIIVEDPSNKMANRELGKLYYQNKKYRQAFPLLKKAFAAKPDAQLAFQLAQSSLKTGDTSTAITYLKKTREMDKYNYKAGLQLARVYYKKEKYPESLSYYRTIYTKMDLSAYDQFCIARSLEEEGHKDKAFSYYQTAIKKYGSRGTKEAIEAHCKLANEYLSNNQFAEALTHFSFIQSRDPKAKHITNIYILLADTYSGLKKSSEAIKELERALTIDNSNIEAYARLADLYAKTKKTSKAKVTYEKMMSLSPNDPHVYFVLGEYNLQAKSYAKALELLQKSNEIKENIDALEGIALAASAMNKWGKAQNAANLVIKKDNTRLKARIVLAKAFMKKKDYKQAKIHLQILVDAKPGVKKFWIDLATCYEQLQNNSGLVEADIKIIALDKKNITSRRRHAVYCLSKGKTDQAYSLFKELTELVPNEADVYKYLYGIALTKNEKTEAIRFLEKYLVLNPNDGNYHKILGDHLYDKNDKDAALSAYKKALTINPSVKGISKRYADMVIAKGNQNDIIKTLKMVITSGEADFGTFQILGDIYKKKSLHKNAIEMYTKALQLDPQDTEVLFALGVCQEKQGDYKNALISYEQCVMMNTKVDIVYKSLGNLYLKQKQFDQAIKNYSKYLERVPNDYATLKKVGEYYYDKKEYARVIQYLSKIKGKTAYKFETRYHLSEAYFNEGKYEKALTLFDELLKRKPKPPASVQLLLMKAQSHEKMGDTTTALTIYDRYSRQKGVKDPDLDFKRAYLREKNNADLARKIYERNIKRYPDDLRNYLQLGYLYNRHKSTRHNALVLLKKAASMGTKEAKKIWFDIAHIYKMNKNEKKELQAYKKYIALDPHNVEANIRIGKLLEKKGKTIESLIYYETANTMVPDNLELINRLANIYLKTNRPQAALMLLKKAKQLKPKNIEMRKLLCKTYIKQKNTKAAKLEISELLAIARDEEMLLLYAEILYQQRRFKESLNSIEDIMAVNPENIDALMLQAKILRRNKKYDNAIESYKEVLFIDGDYAMALFERAETHVLQNKPTWAIQFYERASRAAPNSGLAELGLAKIAKLKKNNDAYVKHLKKAKKLDPENPIIQEEYGKL